MVKRIFKSGVREISLIAVMLALALVAQNLSRGSFFRAENISDFLTESAILAISAVGMMMVILTGGIDLSFGAVMALSGMVGALVLKANNAINPVFIVLIAVAVGAVCGVINGFLVSKLKILPIIATLGAMNVFRGITYLLSDGKWVLQGDMSKEFLNIATGSVFGVNNMVIIAAAVYVAAFVFLRYFRAGRRIYAVGNSVESSAVSGIKTDRVVWLSYVILGAVAGLAGILYVCKFAAAQGETAVGYEMNVIAACVLGGVQIRGGQGKVAGVLLGALLLGLLNNAMPLMGISAFWQQAIRGAIILFSITSNALVARGVSRRALERRAL